MSLQATASPVYACMEVAGAGPNAPARGPAVLTRTTDNLSRQDAANTAQVQQQPLLHNYKTVYPNGQVGQQQQQCYAYFTQDKYGCEVPTANTMSDGGLGG